MKKIFYFIASAIVALGAVACQNDINEGVTPEQEGFSINVTIADQTRVALGDLNEETKQRKLTFTEGDVLVVREAFQVGTNYFFTYTKGEGDVYTFTCEQEGVNSLVGKTPYVFYLGGLHEQADDLKPYGAFCNTAAENISGIGMSANPTCYSGKFGDEDCTISLQTLPVLKFTAQEAVTISSEDNASLFFVNDSWANTYTTTTIGEIYLPVMSSSGNCTVTVTTESGFNKSFTKTLDWGKIYNLGTIEAAAPAPVEVTATITFDNTSKRYSFTTKEQAWKENNIIVINNKTNDSNNIADYSNPARFYKNSELIIEAPGNITKIVFDCVSGYVVAIDGATTNGAVVTIEPSEASNTFTISSLSAQVRVNSITVTYVESGETPDVPVISTLATPENLTTEVDEDNIITVSWDAVDNADSYILTVNGEEIEIEYTDYDIEGDWNTTYEISVVAVAEGYNNSDAATTTVKIGQDPNAAAPEAISIAEFISNADTTTYYELTGVISNVTNTQYGNFDLTDENGDTIYVYGLYSTDGTTNQYWTSSGVKDGDVITIHGLYQWYENTSKHEVVNARYISHYGLTATATATTVDADGGNVTITVSSTGTLPSDITCNVEGEATFTFENNSAVITFDENTTDAARVATVTFTCGLATQSVDLIQNAPTTDDHEPAWTLVTDASTLKVGDKVIIVAKDSNYAMSTTQNSNNRAQAAVTKSGNTLTFTTAVQEFTLKAGTTSGTWAFDTGKGYLYAASSSKNYLRTETSLSANSSWNITIANTGVATVKATGSNTRNWMRYNSSNNPPIFACYGSGQADIAIYRYE